MQEITDAYRKKQTTKKKTDKGGIADIEWTTAIKKKVQQVVQEPLNFCPGVKEPNLVP